MVKFLDRIDDLRDYFCDEESDPALDSMNKIRTNLAAACKKWHEKPKEPIEILVLRIQMDLHNKVKLFSNFGMTEPCEEIDPSSFKKARSKIVSQESDGSIYPLNVMEKCVNG